MSVQSLRWIPSGFLPHLSIEPATEPPGQRGPAPARQVTRNKTAGPGVGIPW